MKYKEACLSKNILKTNKKFKKLKYNYEEKGFVYDNSNNSKVTLQELPLNSGVDYYLRQY
jgi:hypothetical protein